MLRPHPHHFIKLHYLTFLLYCTISVHLFNCLSSVFYPLIKKKRSVIHFVTTLFFKGYLLFTFSLIFIVEKRSTNIIHRSFC